MMKNYIDYILQVACEAEDRGDDRSAILHFSWALFCERKEDV